MKKLRSPIIFYINNKKYNYLFPRTVYINYEIRDLKIHYMDLYLSKYKIDNSFKDHFYNYVFDNNEYFQKKVCLLKFLLDRNIRKISKISTPFLTKRDIIIFKEFGIEIKKIKKRKFVDSVFFLLVRLIVTNIRISLLSRQFYKKKYSRFDPDIKYTKILTAWSLYEVESYLDEIDNSLDNTILYLKPPNIDYIIKKKRKRLLDFIYLLRSGKYNYFEYYPKISFFKIIKNALRIYFYRFPKQIKRCLLGVYIQRIYYDKYIDYVNKNFPDLEEYYSNRAFHSYSTYVTEKLQEKGIKSINISLVLDTGCPIIKYEEAYVCSKVQADCYKAPNTVFKYKKRKEVQYNYNAIKNKPLAVFFVHQALFSEPFLLDSITIRPIYIKVIVEHIERLADDSDIPVYVKYHPSSVEVDKIFSGNVIIIEDENELPEKYRYIVLSYFSSLAVVLLRKMPFLLMNPEGIIDLHHIFPDIDLMWAKSYDELKENVINLKNADEYMKYWKRLVEIMDEYGYGY